MGFTVSHNWKVKCFWEVTCPRTLPRNGYHSCIVLKLWAMAWFASKKSAKMLRRRHHETTHFNTVLTALFAQNTKPSQSGVLQNLFFLLQVMISKWILSTHKFCWCRHVPLNLSFYRHFCWGVQDPRRHVFQHLLFVLRCPPGGRRNIRRSWPSLWQSRSHRSCRCRPGRSRFKRWTFGACIYIYTIIYPPWN